MAGGTHLSLRWHSHGSNLCKTSWSHSSLDLGQLGFPTDLWRTDHTLLFHGLHNASNDILMHKWNSSEGLFDRGIISCVYMMLNYGVASESVLHYHIGVTCQNWKWVNVSRPDFTCFLTCFLLLEELGEANTLHDNKRL